MKDWWRDLVNRYSEEQDIDPVEDALANWGSNETKRLRRVFESLEAEGGFSTVEALYDRGPIAVSTHRFWYGWLLPVFREEFPEDLVRPIGGVTVDPEAAVEAGFLKPGRHDIRYRTTDEFDETAVSLAESCPIRDGEDAYWQLQHLYTTLAENAPMHDYEVVYVTCRIKNICSEADAYPHYLRFWNGEEQREYRQVVADGRYGDFEIVRYDLLTELPGVVEADEYYLTIPEMDPPVGELVETTMTEPTAEADGDAGKSES